MHIARGVHATVWKALKLDDTASPDWKKAVDIFAKRIRERYLDAADALIDAEADVPATQRRFGFVVLAIDCLLVETFGAFIEGLEDTRGRSEAVFCRFLTSRTRFAGDFTSNLATEFYRQFRCGILHQAETGRHALVWSVGPLVRPLGHMLVVNRNEFHTRLTEEFATYQKDLLDVRNVKLRTNFRHKMDFVAGAAASH